MKNTPIIQRAETGLGRLLCAGSGLEPLAGRHRGVGVPREREVVGDLERIGPKRMARKRRMQPEGGTPGVTEKALATMEERLVEMAEMIRAMKGSASEGGAGSEGEPRRPRAVKHDLPRVKDQESGGGKISPQLAVPQFRPGYHRGMIVFTCPSCHYPTAVYPRFAGKKTRCARCYGAILAPRVRKESRPIDMERHIEALLHPERFAGVVTARGGALGRIMTLIPREPSLMKCAGLAILLSGMVALGALRGTGRDGAGASTAGVAKAETALSATGGGAKTFKAEALDLVRRFHEAEDFDGKAVWVRDCGGVLEKMVDHYGRRPEDLARRVVAMRAGGLGFQEGGAGDLPVTTVEVTYDDFSTCRFAVEHHADRSLIEWESSVGYNVRSWGESLAAASARQDESAQPFRVLAAWDDYFNFGYGRADRFLCVRVMAPVGGEVLGYAYAERGSADAREIEAVLREARGAVPLTLELKFTPESASTRQVVIARLVREGWRAGEGSSGSGSGAATLASVGKAMR